MRFNIRHLLFAVILISCVFAVFILQSRHDNAIKLLKAQTAEKVSKAERLATARMLIRVLYEKDVLDETDYRETAYTVFCMAVDSGKDVESWGFDDYTRADVAGLLLEFLGIDKTSDFIRHASLNPNWGIGDAAYLQGTNFIEIASSVSDRSIVKPAKIWKLKSD